MDSIYRISEVSASGSSLSGESQNAFYQKPKFRNDDDVFEYMFLNARKKYDSDDSKEEVDVLDQVSGEDEIDSVIRNTVKRI